MTLFREFIMAATLLACSLELATAANTQSSSGPLHSGFVGSGEDTTPTDLKEEEHEFVRRFNNLFSALLNFASSYNGHVIDAKSKGSPKGLTRPGEIRMVQYTEGGVNGSRAGRRFEIDMKNEKMRQAPERPPVILPSSGSPKVYCGRCHLATPKNNPRCIHCAGRAVSLSGKSRARS